MNWPAVVALLSSNVSYHSPRGVHGTQFTWCARSWVSDLLSVLGIPVLLDPPLYWVKFSHVTRP